MRKTLPISLHQAAEAGLDDLVSQHLTTGADVNALSKPAKWSPLMFACFGGYTSTVKILLEGGADVNQRNKLGQTPLTVTVHGAWMAPSIKKAESTKRNDTGQTAFDLGESPSIKEAESTRRNYGDTIRLLLTRGADVNVSSWLDRTPLQMALLDEQIYGPASSPVAEVLRENGGEEQAENPEPQVSVAPPDLSRAAEAPKFQETVTCFKERFGQPVDDYEEVQGGFFFKTTSGQAAVTVEQEQSNWLERGAFLFRTSDFLRSEDSATEYFGLLPTTDKYQALAAMETGGMSLGGTAKLLAGLKKIEKSDPFVLRFISENTVEGEFLHTVSNPRHLAKQLSELCPDIIEQGVGSEAALAKGMKSTRRLLLWWD